MKCLETRRTPEGFKRRRYLRDDGGRFSTIEVPAELWEWMNGRGRSRNRLAEILREREREAVRQAARALLAEGWKPLAVAHQLNVSVRTVERWRKALQ
jgi:DNA-binding NarL/FixJ family response regulator